MAISFKNVKSELDQDDRVTFGKHAGNTWFWVMENYPDYIIWCVGNTDLSFSKALIVDAIRSKYTIKKRNASTEVDGEYVPEKYHAMSDTFSKKRANFYDGGLRGDMAHYTATQQQEALDSLAQTMFGDDWDNDVPW